MADAVALSSDVPVPPVLRSVKKVQQRHVAPETPPEPMLVAFTLKGEKATRSFRCSSRSQEGPFLVFTSREGWQDKLSYIAISEIATLEVIGHPALVSVPVGASPLQPSTAGPVVSPPGLAAPPGAEALPQGSYSAATTIREMQAKQMLLRSDAGRLQSTVLDGNGNLAVVGAAFMDSAPE